MRAVSQRQARQPLITVTVIKRGVRLAVRRYRCWYSQQFETQRHLNLAKSVGQRPVMPDALKPRWQNVQQESAHELVGILEQMQISPHTIRHTTAMHLLQSGVDISVIALWLGHESPSTTHHYVEADLAMKDRALARLQEPDEKIHRYHAPDSMLDFLKTL